MSNKVNGLSFDATAPFTVYLDVVNGDDVTAQTLNPTKPFRTMRALIEALPDFADETWVIYIIGGVVPITRKMPSRNLNFIAYSETTLDFTNCMEDDGVTHAEFCIRTAATVAKWIFEGSNISIISNYVGIKCLSSIYNGTNVNMSGTLSVVNWKSTNIQSYRPSMIFGIRDANILIMNLYDSPQENVIMSAYGSSIKSYITVDTLYVQYGRTVISEGTLGFGTDVDIRNIVQIGSTSNLSISIPSNKLRLGNITANVPMTISPTSLQVDFYGVLNNNVNISFNGTSLVTGEVISNNYLGGDLYFASPIIFRNFKGRLGKFLLYDGGTLTFDNCNIEVNQKLVSRRYNSSYEDCLVFIGHNTIIQANASDLTEIFNEGTFLTKVGVKITGSLKTNANIGASASITDLTNVEYPYASKVNTISGTYSLLSASFSNVLNKYTSNDSISLVVPTNINMPINVGARIPFLQIGDGEINISSQIGVTISSAIGYTTQKDAEYSLTKFATDLWILDGPQRIPNSIVNNTYFVNTSIGNNSTAVYEDPSMPYATIDYITALPDFKDGCIIFLQNSGTHYINSAIPEKLSITIKSPYIVTLDTSALSILCPNTGALGSVVKNLTIDIPNGTFKCDKGGTASFNYTNDSGYRTLTINASSIYLNTNSYFTNCFQYHINVNALTIANVFLTNNLAGSKYLSNIDEIICLTNSSALFNGELPYNNSVIIGKISGPGRLVFGPGRFEVGNISTTNVCTVTTSVGDDVYIKFNNSIITTADGIELGNYYAGNCTVTGVITSCPKINVIGQQSDLNSSEFKNFVAHLGIGTIGSFGGQIIFENCSISSSNSPINAWNDNGGQIYIRNSSFIMDTPGPLVSGGSGFTNKTVYLLGLNTNATEISPYEGTGINVVRQDEGVQSNVIHVKSAAQIVNRTLSSQKVYILENQITIGSGQSIIVPSTGLTLRGYGFNISSIFSSVSNGNIFTSPVGGSGDLVLAELSITTVGTASKVFNIIDSTSQHAVEVEYVNFSGCKSIGKIDSYRQGTMTTVGFYGCMDGLQLSGTWSGLKITNTNLFSFGATGTFIKKDTNTIFSNRLFLNINADLPTGSKLIDFTSSNFITSELLQINSSIVKVNSIINSDIANTIIPNLSANNDKCLWIGNIGLPDTASENFVDVSVSGAYEIDWLKDTYLLTMTGSTTFSEKNLPASGKNTQEIKIYLQGNYVPTFPSNWILNLVGTYKGTDVNEITLKFIKTGVYFMKISNSLSVYPQPFIQSLTPTSLLPSVTTSLTIMGSFFTPATIVSIENQTVNSVEFINQGQLNLSVTTSAIEEDVDITISNGTSVIFSGVLPINLGVVYIPSESDWENITGSADYTTYGQVKIVEFNLEGTATYNKVIDAGKTYSVYAEIQPSPLHIYVSGNEGYDYYEFIDQVNGDVIAFRYFFSGQYYGVLTHYLNGVAQSSVMYFQTNNTTGFPVKLRFLNDASNFKVYILNSISPPNYLIYNLSRLTNNQKFRVKSAHYDLKNIKYVEQI